MEDLTQLTQTRLKQALRDIEALKRELEGLKGQVDNLQDQLRIEREWREELQNQAENFLEGE